MYLDLSSEGNGRVVAFIKGLPPWTGSRMESAYIELAASFDEYVAKLRIDRESLMESLEHDASWVEHVEAIEEWLEIGLPSWRDDSEIVHALAAARRRVTSGD